MANRKPPRAVRPSDDRRFVTYEMTSDEIARLKERAALAGQTPSVWAGRALREALK